MKNSYFKEMRQNGIRHKREKPLKEIRHGSPLPPYSEGQSFAFKFWAIADRYHANEITVDDLPEDISEIPVMLDTFSAAGIDEILVKTEDAHIADKLRDLGCSPIRESKVCSRETELYTGDLIIQKGTLYSANRQRTEKNVN